MPWTQKQMLRDANGDLIPQYWDVVEQEFKPLTGRDGANDVRLTGSNVEIIADVSDIEVPTGVTGLAIQNLDISKYKYFFIQFIPGGADKYTIQMRPNRGDETVAFTSTNLYKNESGFANRVVEKVEVNCLSASFYIINEMDNDHTFSRMIVFGVRR